MSFNASDDKIWLNLKRLNQIWLNIKDLIVFTAMINRRIWIRSHITTSGSARVIINRWYSMKSCIPIWTTVTDSRCRMIPIGRLISGGGGDRILISGRIHFFFQKTNLFRLLLYVKKKWRKYKKWLLYSKNKMITNTVKGRKKNFCT